MSIFKRFFRKKTEDIPVVEATAAPEPVPVEPPPPINEISPTELPEMMANDSGTQVIDLRLDWAYQSGHIPGAQSLSMMELMFRMDELPRDKTLVLQCYHGIDSLGVAAYLIQEGWAAEQVYSLSGGIAGWVETHGADSLEKEPAS